MTSSLCRDYTSAIKIKMSAVSAMQSQIFCTSRFLMLVLLQLRVETTIIIIYCHMLYYIYLSHCYINHWEHFSLRESHVHQCTAGPCCPVPRMASTDSFIRQVSYSHLSNQGNYISKDLDLSKEFSATAQDSI